MAESTRRTPPTDARAAVTSGGTLATPPGSGVACADPASAEAAGGATAHSASPIVAESPSFAGSRLSLMSNVIRAGQSARWAMDAADASWFFAAFSVWSAGSTSRPSRCVIRFSEMLSVTRFRSSLRPSRRSITFWIFAKWAAVGLAGDESGGRRSSHPTCWRKRQRSSLRCVMFSMRFRPFASSHSAGEDVRNDAQVDQTAMPVEERHRTL